MITQLSQDVLAAKGKLDSNCKNLLAFKVIIAHILKGCVEEFRNEEIPYIISCIEGEPEVSETPVHYSCADGDRKIDGISSETPESNENNQSVTYDIRFRVRFYSKNHPGTYQLIEMIINLEAQNKYRPSTKGSGVKHSTYHIMSRSVYYGCRQISAQYGRDFSGSDYDSIKKVYTIWICNDPPARLRNTVSEYRYDERDLYGHAETDPKYYDLMRVVMIRLGRDDKTEILNYDGESNILRLLRVLFSSEISATDKLRIMEDEFGIDKSKYDIESEVNEMCNISDGVFEKGVNQGKTQGFFSGSSNEKYETVMRMLEDNADDTLIIKYAGVTAEILEEIKKKLSRNQK